LYALKVADAARRSAETGQMVILDSLMNSVNSRFINELSKFSGRDALLETRSAFISWFSDYTNAPEQI